MHGLQSPRTEYQTLVNEVDVLLEPFPVGRGTYCFAQTIGVAPLGKHWTPPSRELDFQATKWTEAAGLWIERNSIPPRSLVAIGTRQGWSFTNTVSFDDQSKHFADSIEELSRWCYECWGHLAPLLQIHTPLDGHYSLLALDVVREASAVANSRLFKHKPFQVSYKCSQGNSRCDVGLWLHWRKRVLGGLPSHEQEEIIKLVGDYPGRIVWESTALLTEIPRVFRWIQDALLSTTEAISATKNSEQAEARKLEVLAFIADAEPLFRAAIASYKAGCWKPGENNRKTVQKILKGLQAGWVFGLGDSAVAYANAQSGSPHIFKMVDSKWKRLDTPSLSQKTLGYFQKFPADKRKMPPSLVRDSDA